MVAYHDPHARKRHMSEWTHEGFKADLELSGTNKCIFFLLWLMYCFVFFTWLQLTQ